MREFNKLSVILSLSKDQPPEDGRSLGEDDPCFLVPKLHLGTPLSAKLRFTTNQATQLQGHGRSQVQLENDGATELILRQAQDDGLKIHDV